MKLKNLFKRNYIFLLLILFFTIFCILIKSYCSNYILLVDDKVSNFFINNMTNKKIDIFMKIITKFCDFSVAGLVVLLILLITNNKFKNILYILDASFILIICSSIKIIFKRQRPQFALINIPKTYSFPSGHTFFATAFYGFFLFNIFKTNISKGIKYLLVLVLSVLIILIAVSRIYLNVHYFTDVLCGFIYGIFTLMIFINIYNERKE